MDTERTKETRKSTKQLRGEQINWNQMFYFCQIATYGSIKEAAAKLGLTSPTLSQHLAQLEEDLDIDLFHRHHRKLALTPQGARLFQYVKQMFDMGQRLVDVVSPVPFGSYPISIGLVPCPSMQLAYTLVDLYLSEFGPINVRASQAKHDELERGILEAKYDFGFSDHAPDRPEIKSQLISSSTLSFYVASKWAETKFSDLIAKLPLLICSAEPNSRTVIERLLEETDLAPSSVVSSDYPSLLLELCEKGRGIGIFGEESLAPVNRSILRSFRVSKGAPRLRDKLYVLWSKDSENAEVVYRLKEILPRFKEFKTGNN